jgi:hypothetical protein
VTFVTYFMLTRALSRVRPLTSTSNESVAWYASSTRILAMRVPRRTSQLGSRRSVVRIWCLILLRTFVFEHFEHFAFERLERLESERSRITVPSWHGLALLESWEHGHLRAVNALGSCDCVNERLVLISGSTFAITRVA